MTDRMAEDVAHGGAARGEVRIWDPLVRLFHWSLALAFTIAWLTADELQPVHEFAGYTVAGLIAFRLVWGVVGSRHARFAQFLRGPAATLAYLADALRGRERRYLGHNPAGAAMVVAMLAALAGTTFTGWLIEEPERAAMLHGLPQIVTPAHADEDEGYERGEAGEEREGPVEEVHETLANLALLLVALHVGGVVLASFRHHENLPRAMVTGMKRAAGPGDLA